MANNAVLCRKQLPFFTSLIQIIKTKTKSAIKHPHRAHSLNIGHWIEIIPPLETIFNWTWKSKAFIPRVLLDNSPIIVILPSCLSSYIMLLYVMNNVSTQKIGSVPIDLNSFVATQTSPTRDRKNYYKFYINKKSWGKKWGAVSAFSSPAFMTFWSGLKVSASISQKSDRSAYFSVPYVSKKSDPAPRRSITNDITRHNWKEAPSSFEEE